MDREVDKLNSAASDLVKKLKTAFGSRVLGPEFALIPRVKNLYLKKVLIKIGKDESASKTKETIRRIITDIQQKQEYKSIRVQPDVDPV